MIHFHVASGLQGYGPDCDEGTPLFDSLSDALSYARDELSVYIGWDCSTMGNRVCGKG